MLNFRNINFIEGERIDMSNNRNAKKKIKKAAEEIINGLITNENGIDLSSDEEVRKYIKEIADKRRIPRQQYQKLNEEIAKITEKDGMLGLGEDAEQDDDSKKNIVKKGYKFGNEEIDVEFSDDGRYIIFCNKDISDDDFKKIEKWVLEDQVLINSIIKEETLYNGIDDEARFEHNKMMDYSIKNSNNNIFLGKSPDVNDIVRAEKEYAMIEYLENVVKEGTEEIKESIKYGECFKSDKLKDEFSKLIEGADNITSDEKDELQGLINDREAEIYRAIGGADYMVEKEKWFQSPNEYKEFVERNIVDSGVEGELIIQKYPQFKLEAEVIRAQRSIAEKDKRLAEIGEVIEESGVSYEDIENYRMYLEKEAKVNELKKEKNPHNPVWMKEFAEANKEKEDINEIMKQKAQENRMSTEDFMEILKDVNELNAEGDIISDEKMKREFDLEILQKKQAEDRIAFVNKLHSGKKSDREFWNWIKAVPKKAIDWVKNTKVAKWISENKIAAGTVGIGVIALAVSYLHPIHSNKVDTKNLNLKSNETSVTQSIQDTSKENNQSKGQTVNDTKEVTTPAVQNAKKVDTKAITKAVNEFAKQENVKKQSVFSSVYKAPEAVVTNYDVSIVPANQNSVQEDGYAKDKLANAQSIEIQQPNVPYQESRYIDEKTGDKVVKKWDIVNGKAVLVMTEVYDAKTGELRTATYEKPELASMYREKVYNENKAMGEEQAVDDNAWLLTGNKENAKQEMEDASNIIDNYDNSGVGKKATKLPDKRIDFVPIILPNGDLAYDAYMINKESVKKIETIPAKKTTVSKDSGIGL